MSSNWNRSLKIEVNLPSTHPELLQGLDIWLRLGLISDAQVKELSRKCLVCHVALKPQTVPESQNVETLSATSLQQDNTQPAVKKPNVFAKMLQSLGEELSVRWLLFLGMFLVVVSSGVLAASQWEKFPPSGQYGVLLAYTLSFWGISFWAGKQSNLNLTTRALLIVTLLLVPVNFWAIDSFQLWKNPLNWIVVAIASVILTAVTVLACHNRLFATTQRLRKLPLFTILTLSYLHWGWQLPQFPLIAVYLGTTATTITTFYHTRYQQKQAVAAQDDEQFRFDISLPSVVIIYSLIILILRAIFVAHVDIQELGLAIGLCGWLVAWLAQQRRKVESRKQEAGEEITTSSPPLPLPPSPTPPFLFISGTLIFLGWIVSVSTPFPWQATAVSVLGLWFFNSRLQWGGVRADVGAIFIIGLETIWLCWRLVPSQLQNWAITVSTELTNSQDTPWGLLGVALFPYVIVMLALADRLHRTQKALALFAEQLTLVFGVVLTVISVENSTLRCINLFLSTIILARVSLHRSPTRKSLVYMTQIAGVLTFCSIIDRILPNLRQEVWASLLLAVAVAEWFFSIGNGIWRRSAWHIGLGLATLSYVFLWGNAELFWRSSGDGSQSWGLIWLITPITLTSIASLGYRTQARTIAPPNVITWLSVVALGLAQLLTLPLAGGRLISLAVATALMFVNTSYLRQTRYAVITVGFGLSFITALIWEGVPGLARLSVQGWFVVGAVSIVSLWQVWRWMKEEGGNFDNSSPSSSTRVLSQIYATATDKWAIALCIVELLLLSIHSLLVYQGFVSSGFLYLISCAVILGAIVYRSWRQPSHWGFYGIGWCLELLIAELLGFGERSVMKIAVANLALGLITQLLGEWWQRRFRLERLPNRWHILPLIYGIFAVLLRWDTFARWTGLSSFAVAVIAIGVGRRRQELKPLVYLGLVVVSVSAYELLIYQLLQVSGGALGDGLIAMSILGTAIMYAYRILSPWLLHYLRLSGTELEIVAHIHWVVSSFLLIAASLLPVEAKTLGLGTGVFLIRYAIFQGRLREKAGETSTSPLNPLSPSSSLWVYLGLLEIAVLKTFLPDIPLVSLFEKQLLPWQSAVAAIIAYFLYILPWERWGWSQKPWQHTAYILPLVFLWQTRIEVFPISLLIVASFYIFVAKASNTFRFTYISVALIDWALFRWFLSLHLVNSLWYVIPIGLSLLYIAQLNPHLKLHERKASRHFLRLLGCGVICGWAVIFHQDTALIPGAFSLIAIFAGLALRVRAFLYVGVATFFGTSFYQLILLSLRYPFFKWVVGLLVGIILISLAANFETRREQLNSLFRNTAEELHEWE